MGAGLIDAARNVETLRPRVRDAIAFMRENGRGGTSRRRTEDLQAHRRNARSSRKTSARHAKKVKRRMKGRSVGASSDEEGYDAKSVS